MEKNDRYAVVTNVIESLEKGGSYEDRLDASDLPREQKKAVRAYLQKSIDENLEALKNIKK
ncbi:hypothetical protein KVL09_03640 [Helicobacter pylori]|uniref:hypothetical protein n=1 Tax=Helicobacter pylori TaxID=210 RepID=UPI0002B9B47C|nr:hypothetical protein [Helicobacter pylori]WQW73021.1 hypothetical protein KVL09_03640 [Helicobacter pylori]